MALQQGGDYYGTSNVVAQKFYRGQDNQRPAGCVLPSIDCLLHDKTTYSGNRDYNNENSKGFAEANGHEIFDPQGFKETVSICDRRALEAPPHQNYPVQNLNGMGGAFYNSDSNGQQFVQSYDNLPFGKIKISHASDQKSRPKPTKPRASRKRAAIAQSKKKRSGGDLTLDGLVQLLGEIVDPVKLQAEIDEQKSRQSTSQPDKEIVQSSQYSHNGFIQHASPQIYNYNYQGYTMVQAEAYQPQYQEHVQYTQYSQGPINQTNIQEVQSEDSEGIYEYFVDQPNYSNQGTNQGTCQGFIQINGNFQENVQIVSQDNVQGSSQGYIQEYYQYE
ncbi:uncharacterized protein CELE_ZK177.1 [Caenorhabditis elegans]|uniref:Uncharacterized protein ZK177.1 n=1 Tax=Caenorhabditis elegans TaxID=6239 RepID=YS41_CAEEL|nr:Uncharacterized protein CELE_ZK177.1 [Caenorhabditis elegans]Q09370.2 RecName: Full=Uncharacterized protein ZK177.1 [Caenorhabditis elegans]CCD64855.2 Uncharacterized protein CELE_ZK177.1 [Caenorhabditis elegans]|eukprot:NP_495060.2 Uncharacterized protein CELE_ZK177.1 [Caenorhabditis elegans]